MNKLPKHTYPYVKHKQAQKPNEQNKQAKASTGGIKQRLENSEQLSYLHNTSAGFNVITTWNIACSFWKN